MLVGKKQMSVGEFPVPRAEMSGIPCNARPKNGRGGKTRPRAYRGEKKGKKFVIWGKKVFCRLEKQNVGWKKNLSVEKKNVGWRISPPKNGHVRNVRNSL